MEINEKIIAGFLGILAILGYFVNILKKFFKTQRDVEDHDRDIKDLKEKFESLEDSRIKNLEVDLQQFKISMDKDFQDLKNTVERAIVEGNSAIEKTINELHIKLLDKISDIKTSNSND